MATPVSDSFLGTWEQYEISNAEQLADMLGVPADKKSNALAMMQSMTLEVTHDGEFVNMKTTTPSGSREVKIKPGEESEYTTTTGLKMRTCPKELTPNKIVQTLKDESGANVIGELTSEVIGDELISTMNIRDIVSVRKYKKK